MINKKDRSDNVDIAAGIKTRGCPACDYVLERVLEFFAQWVSDLAENDDARKENARAQGLCPFHTWQMETMGSPLGISRGYSPLMRQIAVELQKGCETQTQAASVLGVLINDAGNCRICRLIKQETSTYLSYMANFLKIEENRRLYSTSGGLCLRHLYDLTGATTDPELMRFLLATAAKQFAAIADDMDRYSSKRSASQKHLLTVTEKNAYLRGLIHVAGGRFVFNPPHEALPISSGLAEGYNSYDEFK